MILWPIVKWQKPMVTVLYGIAPIALSSIYFFGWRAAAMLAVCNLAAVLTEFAFLRASKQPVSSAVFVSGTLLALSLPPAFPFWMAVVGAVFGVAFGKMVFGGFGKNVFNPALSGRAFIYVSFGGPMTTQWSEPVAGRLGGFGVWASDAMTQATPGILYKQGVSTPLPDLLLGHTAGVLGGTSAILVLLGGLYITWKKAANYRIVISGIVGYLLAQTVFWAFHMREHVPDPISSLLAGSALIGIFFYATDPVSASQTNLGRWIYGAFVGVLSSAIAVFSAWPAGTMFAILLGNTFAPIMDYVIRERQSKTKAASMAKT